MPLRENSVRAFQNSFISHVLILTSDSTAAVLGKTVARPPWLVCHEGSIAAAGSHSTVVERHHNGINLQIWRKQRILGVPKFAETFEISAF
jgi:hypothetical protein